MNKKLKLLGLALGITVLLALSLGGAVMAADGRDRGANCGDCLEGALPEGVDCPRLDADGTADLETCPRWGEDADRICLDEDGECDGTGCLANEGEVTGAGNCWRGEQAERPCLDEAGECDGTGCLANEGEVTGAGNCWRGEQAERPCLDEAGENVAAGSGCMRGGR
jgi:hypothetical protein